LISLPNAKLHHTFASDEVAHESKYNEELMMERVNFAGHFRAHVLDGSVNSLTKLPAVHEGRQRTRKTPCISESDKTVITTLGEIFSPQTIPFKERCETKVKYS